MKKLLQFSLTITAIIALVISCAKEEPELTKYVLTITASDGGKVSTPGGTYVEGETARITATADSGYIFVRWSNGSTDNPLIFTVNSNVSIQAIFEKETYSASIGGAVAKGAYVAGSDLKFYELSESLNQTGKSYSTNTSDDLGTFSLNVQEITEEYARIEAEGYYWNEVTNEITEDKLRLNAISNIKENINVNILTHLEYDRVIELVKNQGKSFADAKAQAVDEVLSSLGIEISQNYGNAESYNFRDGDEASKVLLAASAVVLANKSQSEVSSLIAKIANDIKDNGNIDDQEIQKQIAENLYVLNIEELSNNVYERYKVSNSNLTTESFTSSYIEIVESEFQQFIPDSDNDGITDPIDYCPDTPENEEANENGCSISQQYFELDTNVVGQGSISEEVIETDKSSHIYNTRLKVTANPLRGWVFIGWSGDIISNENPIEITMDKNISIVATFELFDSDGDGVTDENDLCNNTPDGATVDENGCQIEPIVFLDANGVTVRAYSSAKIGDKGIFNNILYEIVDNNLLKQRISEGVDLTTLCTSRVTDMKEIFRDNFNMKGEVKSWDTRNVNDMSGLFYGVYNLNQDLSYWNTGNVTDMSAMFLRAPVTSNIGLWDVSSVKKMNDMFWDNQQMNQPIGNWNVSNVEEMHGMFWGATNFTQDISSWDVSKVKIMSYMFAGINFGEDLSTLRSNNFNGDISQWDVSSVESMSFMFFGNNKFNSNISDWNTKSLKNMIGIFENATSFNQNLNNWDVSGVTSLEGVFKNATSFNESIENWDVSNVTDMTYAFARAESFNQNIGNWNVKNNTRLVATFQGALSFNSDLSSWDTSSLDNLHAAFEGATNFNQPLNNWNVSKVGDFSRAFNGAISFNQPLNNWFTENALQMYWMFYNANSFSQDLSNWCVSNFTNEPELFSQGSQLTNEQLPKWGTCVLPDEDLDGVPDIYDICSGTLPGLEVDENGCEIKDVSVDINAIIPIPSSDNIEHVYFTRAPGRMTYEDVTKFKKLVYLKDIYNNIKDSLLYDPNTEKNITLPIPKEPGEYYYDEITYYEGEINQYSSRFINYIDPTWVGQNRLEYRIFSNTFNYPTSEPDIQIEYAHDALVYIDDPNVIQLTVPNNFNTDVNYMYLNSIIEEYPIRVLYDGYYYDKVVSVTKDGVSKVTIEDTDVPVIENTTSNWSNDELYGRIDFNSPTILYDILDIFLEDASSYNKTFSKSVNFNFTDNLSIGNQDYLALTSDVCTNNPKINVSINDWNQLSNGQKIVLIYHELGHALLEYDHQESGIMNENVIISQFKNYSVFMNQKEIFFNESNRNMINCSSSKSKFIDGIKTRKFY